ncbi:uncharacterized protein MEPE_02687 [Melanopsichium pennsylvanicum]|uniref:Uncharacterized protein n=1 Tax=Melanopsichium pennsylvanicum TaxID=63383 RepID=A0AAJ4XJQ1_9BASI|nr:uncharacterized protein MEPE_02687 [Melanopsichium pennsylvanicum]
MHILVQSQLNSSRRLTLCDCLTDFYLIMCCVVLCYIFGWCSECDSNLAAISLSLSLYRDWCAACNWAPNSLIHHKSLSPMLTAADHDQLLICKHPKQHFVKRIQTTHQPE